MKKYKLYTLILAVIFSITNTYAQTLDDNYSEVRSYLNSMFQQLNKNRVPTGLLLDYGIDLVDLEDYDGTILADSTYVNVDIYRDILKTIISSDVKTNYNSSYNSVKAKIDALDNVSVDGPITLSAAFFRYNVIKPNAIEDNLIVYDETNNKVRDAFNENGWINPYDTKNLFAVSVGAQRSESFSVQYILPDEYYFTNSAITQMHFDAGDGLGYRPYLKNSTIAVNYTTEGIKTLKFRIRTLQGQYLESHTYIQIKLPDASIQGGSIYTTKDYNETIDGVTLSARIVYNSSISSQILKPFIVVEGFDPWMLQDIYQSNTNNGHNPYPQSNIHTGYTDYEDYKYVFNNILHDEYRYDVIYVDWDNCTADIKKNAILLQKIVKDINLMKASTGSTEKNVILGLSMGGLIARYALRDMEMKNETHEVAAYISGDTPHLGVNVPIGYQILLNQLLSFIHGYDNTLYIADLFLDGQINESEKIIKDIITSDAAKQMMYRYVNGTYISDDCYNAWQQELTDMGFPQGDYGKGMILLAMANNSSSYDANSLIESTHLLSAKGYVKASILSMLAVKLFDWLIDTGDNLDKILDFGTILGSNRIDIDVEVNPFSYVNVGKTLSKFKLTYTKKFLWLFPKTFTIFNSHVYMPANNLYYEDFPGSKYSFRLKDMNGIEHNNAQYLFSWSDSGILGEYSLSGGFSDYIMFVPTASALNITNNGNPLTMANYKNDYATTSNPITNTPFHSYYIDVYDDPNGDIDTREHIMFSPNAYKWIANQINMNIDGPDVALASAQYTVSGLNDSEASISWSVSDDTVASIDDSGKLTILKNGVVDVIACYWNQNGKLYRKTKSVLVEFPDIAITKRYAAGYGYKFSATIVDDYNSTLSDIISSCNLQCEWSLIDSDGNVITETIPSSSFEYLPENDEAVTITFRLVDRLGNKSDMRSVSFNLKTPFNSNYTYVVVNTYGGVYFIKEDNTYDIGLPTDDLTITFRNEIMNDNDNLMTLISKYLKGNNCYMDCYNANSGYGVSLVGSKVSMSLKWSFNLFDHSTFIEDIESAINYEGTTRQVISEYDLVIKNSAFEALQRMPFRIIYNPYFGIL